MMSMKKHVSLFIAICLMFAVSFNLLGCESSKPADQEITGEERPAPVGGETANDEHIYEERTEDPEPGQVEDTTDYSQMSNEEIIVAFMKAWEEQNTEAMDELSYIPKLNGFSFYYQQYGYNTIFGEVGFTLSELDPEYKGDRPLCTHGCENYSHEIYDLEIRQSDYYDYGVPPEELESTYKHYQDVYYVYFSFDEDSVIYHLDFCLGNGHKPSQENGKYWRGYFFRMRYDEERGHRVIANYGHVPDQFGR